MTAELIKKNIELERELTLSQMKIAALLSDKENSRRVVRSLIRTIAGEEADGYGFSNNADDALDELTELILSTDWKEGSEEKEMIFAEVINICFKDRG